MKIFAAIIAVVLFWAIDLKGGTTPAENTIYDSDINHLWNRLNEALFVRTAQDGKTFGLDELDILYWASTKHLLVEPSRGKALTILDEFINTHGENLIRDPLKRALLQRDLWELFDWSAKPFRNSDDARACHELQSRLAVAIRRLALTTNEIASLPDNYAQSETNNLPDLPRGLFQTSGDWVSVRDNNDSLTAPTHVAAFDGHSTFGVALHVPGGRQAAISYLDKLRTFAHVERLWVHQTNRDSWFSTNAPKEILELNPEIPQFPTNTEWALVRRMCVIDTEGRIQPTPFTESIQLRRYRSVQRGIPDSRLPEFTNIVQQFLEFELDRRQNGALRAIGKDGKGFSFVHFMGKGIDLFEPPSWRNPNEHQPQDSATLQSVTLRTCIQCHSARGIFSVNSYTRSLSFSMSSERPANLTPSDVKREATETIYWKQRQFDWGLLQGLWRQGY